MNMNDETRHFNKYAQIIDLNQIHINAVFNQGHREGNFILKQLPKNMKGKKILDLGCGIGVTSIFFAKQGASVIGIDISPKMISKASKLANIHNTIKIKFRVGNVEKLDYLDQSFDIIFGKSILHHVNYSKVIDEIYRVLKPGGIALFSDPLSYNPMAILYDKFVSKGLRSKTERRLTLNDISLMRQKFKKVKWIGINISAFILFAFDFLYLKLTKSRIPINWFERVEYGQVLSNSFTLCDRIDRLIPKFVQLLGWRIVISCRK